MTTARKLAGAALLAASCYYTSSAVLAWDSCEDFRSLCYGSDGTFYYWGNCSVSEDGVTCGDYSCGSGSSYGSPTRCCWSTPVGYGS